MKCSKLQLGGIACVAAAIVGVSAAILFRQVQRMPQLFDSIDVEESSAASSTTISAEPSVPTTETTTVTTEAHVYTELPEELELVAQPTLEVYAHVTPELLITQTNGEVEAGEPIDTDTLGAHTTKIRVRYEERRYETTVSYQVVDTTPPLILNNGADAIHKQGETFDLKDYIGYADNYDPNPTLTVEGTVDPETVGSYTLTATVTDHAGNAERFSLVVRVRSTLPTPSDTAKRIPFTEFCAKYAGEQRAFGIDVSSWQGDVDFAAVRAAGCEFVILRIAACYRDINEDKCFRKNFESAREAGLKVGIYLYTTANTEEKIREQTAWIVEMLAGAPLDFPVVFDWEDFSTFQEYGMSIHELNRLFDVFAEEMDAAGYGAMLYSSKNFLVNFWEDVSPRSVWLAHYVNETNYQGDYALWQATPRGRIDGIAHDVDFNIWYQDRALLLPE